MTCPSRQPLSLLVLALAALAAGCTSEIQHDLDEGQANQILVLLNQQGIAARKHRDEAARGKSAWVIAVPSAEAARAWQILREHELPPRPVKGFGEVFAQPSLIPSATEERALLHEALSGEIARTLKSIEGVVDARVHLVLPEPPSRLGEGPPPRPRAAVLLKLRKGTTPAPALGPAEVQKLVAGSVARLDPADVAVVTTYVGAGLGRSTGAAALAALGPLRVESGSLSLLRLLLGGTFGAVVLLAGLVILLAVRLSDARRRMQRLEVERDGLAQQVAGPGGTGSFVRRG